ncbi:hypothetical protein Taro_042591 [Colocasia esculenta]|uniref:VAL1-3 N-terminal zinc finger domain-containing protein n=1 Tax=Colocasia esculenta TaxID=4460 RepID=A0A843WZV6_COLES|nr:hypothetical protein [Colocasia esculenta]
MITSHGICSPRSAVPFASSSSSPSPAPLHRALRGGWFGGLWASALCCARPLPGLMSSSSSSAAASAAAAGAAAVPPSPGKICFNAHCKERVVERPPPWRRGWRLRSGELAELCDRCSVAYEQGNFCETFHLDEDGWRKCHSCGKRVHCGCLVSIATFMLLDAGGIECISCARKNFIMGPNSSWSSSILFPLGPERLKDLSAKSGSQITASIPVPGQWRQASNLWNTSQSELQQRLSYEFDRPNGADRLIPGARLTIPSQDKKKIEDPDRATSHINHVQLGRTANGKSPFGSLPTFSELHREDGNADGLHDSSHPVGEADVVVSRKGAVLDPSSSTSAGINFKALPGSTANVSLASALKDDPSVALIGLPAPFPPPGDLNDSARVSSAQTQRQLHASPLSKQSYPGIHNAADPSGESQSQVRNGRPRADARSRSQLLPRYWPRITDQELQQISGEYPLHFLQPI